jgi:hypothetical protein
MKVDSEPNKGAHAPGTVIAALRAQNAELVEALKIVLSCWVNGREVRDGIPLTALEQAKRAILGSRSG